MLPKYKAALSITLVLVSYLMLGTLGVDAASNEGGNVSEGWYAYHVEAAAINAPSAIIDRFYGDAASKLKRDKKEKEFVRYASKNGKYVAIFDVAAGFFDIDKPGKISRNYYGEGMDSKNPRVSQTLGRYTGEEAAQMGLDFLQEVIGMDTRNLHVKAIDYREQGKEKSRIYQIRYAYVLDGRDVLSWPVASIDLWVSDDGVEGAYGTALSFTRGDAISPDALLTEERINNSASRKGDYELAYQVTLNDGKFRIFPSWNLITDANNPLAYDAQTGEKIEVW